MYLTYIDRVMFTDLSEGRWLVKGYEKPTASEIRQPTIVSVVF
jgi:hypothetical protein